MMYSYGEIKRFCKFNIEIKKEDINTTKKLFNYLKKILFDKSKEIKFKFFKFDYNNLIFYKNIGFKDIFIQLDDNNCAFIQFDKQIKIYMKNESYFAIELTLFLKSKYPEWFDDENNMLIDENKIIYDKNFNCDDITSRPDFLIEIEEGYCCIIEFFEKFHNNINDPILLNEKNLSVQISH